MNINLTYTVFQTKVIEKDIPYHHIVEGDSYTLFAFNGNIEYTCSLNSSTEIAHYITNYSSDANVNVIPMNPSGKPIFAPTIEDVGGLYPKKKMYKHNVNANSINIFDITVDSQKRICGGEYWILQDDVDKIGIDDYVEFAIVDKDDVLGLFALYGLSKENGDILELTKFVITDYIKKGDKFNGYHSILYEGIKGTNKLVDGLYMRCIVNNSGTEAFTLLWRCYFYE